MPDQHFGFSLEPTFGGWIAVESSCLSRVRRMGSSVEVTQHWHDRQDVNVRVLEPVTNIKGD